MQELRDRIVKDGLALGTDVLKVDSFLNHQIDPGFTMKMGEELARRFAVEKITKVLTVEASGIAIAMAVALALKVPIVFAKKKKAITQDDDSYIAQVFSFTKKESVNISVSAKFLGKDDTVLVVDDFLAHGEALKGMVSIVHQAGAKLAGAGIVIEKRFQKGGEALRAEGVRIESLAIVDSLQSGVIKFG